MNRRSHFSSRTGQLSIGCLSLCALIIILPLSARSKIELEHLKLSAPMRHDYRYDFDTRDVVRDRVQYQGSLSYGVRFYRGEEAGQLGLWGLLGTGNRYTSQWNTVANFNDGTPGEHHLNMRQIYLQWQLKRWRAQLGVIPPVKGKVSETSLDKDGWIRGARLILPMQAQGQLEWVAGVLDNLDDANAFQSWGALNYLEVEWTQSWDPHWRTELGGVHLDSALILRSEVRYAQLYLLGGKSELAAEVLRNTANDVWAHDWSIAQRIGVVTVTNEYAYVPRELGLLGSLSNDFFTFGHLWVLGIKGPFFGDSRFYWFGRNYLGEQRVNFKLGVGVAMEH